MRTMQIDYYEAVGGDSDWTLVWVGGTGDTKERSAKIIGRLREKVPKYNICAFTFAEVDSPEKYFPQQVRDLEEVCQQLIDDHRAKNISIFCTSAGAYSTCSLMINPKFEMFLKEVIFCDPADYYLNATRVEAIKSWSGHEVFNPGEKTTGEWLKEITSEVLGHVVHFTLRNHGPEKYIEKEDIDRGKDNPDGYPRLNAQMVRAFYDNLPEKNRGKYVKQPDLPHAFLKDGNVEENEKKVVELIVKLIGN